MYLQLDSLCELARLGLGTLKDPCSKENLSAAVDATGSWKASPALGHMHAVPAATATCNALTEGLG